MIGKAVPQQSMFDVGNVYDLKMDAASFHYQLAKVADKLFNAEDFAVFYKAKKGRPSVLPSLLALLTLMQHEAGISDDAAVKCSAYDLRWVAVLRKEAGIPLCAKSTLQLFRAHLILHPEVEAIFLASIQEAKRTGLLKGKALQIALDTKPIRGRGAVQDTLNLLGSGILQLARRLAREAGKKLDVFLIENGLARYTKASVKGSADIDWSDEEAKKTLLTEIVKDAQRLLSLLTSPSEAVLKAASLLELLLLQDVEVTNSEDGLVQASIKDGTAKGRQPSATDPDVRHGRKSASKRFNGHKADVAVDQESQIIVAFGVLAGDAGDASGALALVEQAEKNTAMKVEDTTGDCAYGGGPTREAFAKEGRELLAKVPQEYSRNGKFSKSDFKIDLENNQVTCPAGHISTRFQLDKEGNKQFSFGSVCKDCPLSSQCTSSKSGRHISVHPQEAQLRAARAYQKTPEGKAKLRKRVVVEHRLARLGQLGIGQARYRGRANTRFQLMIAASLANFRWVWNQEAATAAEVARLEAQSRHSNVNDRMFASRNRMRTPVHALMSILNNRCTTKKHAWEG